LGTTALSALAAGQQDATNAQPLRNPLSIDTALPTGSIAAASAGDALPGVAVPTLPERPIGLDRSPAPLPSETPPQRQPGAVAAVGASAPRSVATDGSQQPGPAALFPPATASPPATSNLSPPAASDGAAAPLSRTDLRLALDPFAKADPRGLAEYRFANPILRRQRTSIAAFYALRDDEPLWVSGSQWSPTARLIIDFLSHAADDGLDLAAFPIPTTPGEAAPQKAAAELALSEAIAGYAFEATGGRVDPARISPLIGDKPHVADAKDALVEVAIAADPVAVLRDYEPEQAGYVALRQELQAIRAKETPLARTRIPAGPPLRVGMRDPRVSLIRARFGLDPAPADAGSRNPVYDTVVASAVAGFQRANGLPASGVLTSRTLAALSAGPENIQNEVLANMERWRWAPRDDSSERIEVNIPEYTLRLYQDGAVTHRARVVVGKPGTPTPLFSNEVKYLTVNPSWYVPQSIVEKEMLPKLARDPEYLARQGYEVTRHGDTISVRQPPGDRNALGHIVFWFPNQYAVYLHDTPTRYMFASEKRAFSHGCVRLEQPFKLAEMVLGHEHGWTQEKLESLIGSSEHYLNLPRSIPIHLQYFTASVDEAGKLKVFDDIYGLSKRVQAALGLQS
jgi:murein L,D-transpeptidase YcbB/YkuD